MTARSDAYTRHLLEETREELNRADTKASIVLVGAGVAIGALLAGLFSGSIDLRHGSGASIPFEWLAAAILLGAVGCLGAAVYREPASPNLGGLGTSRS